MNDARRLSRVSRRLVRAVGALSLPLGLAGFGLAGPPETKLAPSDPQANGRFGASAAADGDVAVLGAPAADGGLGAAYVVERTGGVWSVRSKLTATAPSASVQFGSAVAVSGDTVLVGAWREDGFRGAAYVFTRGASGAWTQRQRLLPSDLTNDRRFGVSVAVSGDTAVIGAVGDAVGGEYSGSAYVFVRDGSGVWTERQKLTASDAAVRDFFGAAVAVSGGTAVIGAPRIVQSPPTPGEAYVFTRDAAGAWAQREILSDGVTGSGFANSVAVAGGTAVVGALGDDVGRGAAYVYEPDGAGAWVLRQKHALREGRAAPPRDEVRADRGRVRRDDLRALCAAAARGAADDRPAGGLPSRHARDRNHAGRGAGPGNAEPGARRSQRFRLDPAAPRRRAGTHP